MSVETYQVKTGSFERFYNLFLYNTLRTIKYKIILTDGATAVGVPTVGAGVNPFDPSVSFNFWSEGESYQIPFSVLEDVTAAVEG